MGEKRTLHEIFLVKEAFIAFLARRTEETEHIYN
jgi:hypothetical protein